MLCPIAALVQLLSAFLGPEFLAFVRFPAQLKCDAGWKVLTKLQPVVHRCRDLLWFFGFTFFYTR